MKEVPLLLTDKLITKGKVSYHEGAQTFNTIRLKKQLINQFPELKNKQNKIVYRIELYQKYKEIINRLFELEAKKEPVPLLLFLYKHEI